MLKFYNRTVRVNEMGGRVFVEVKNKAFEASVVRDAPPFVDEVSVKEFDTVEKAEKFIRSVVP